MNLPPHIKSNAEAKSMWSYTATPLYVFVASFIIEHVNKCFFFTRQNKRTRTVRKLLHQQRMDTRVHNIMQLGPDLEPEPNSRNVA